VTRSVWELYTRVDNRLADLLCGNILEEVRYTRPTDWVEVGAKVVREERIKKDMKGISGGFISAEPLIAAHTISVAFSLADSQSGQFQPP
jgi:hypothetical protein